MFTEGDVAAFCRPVDERAYRLLFNLESYLRFMLRWEIIGAHGKNWVGVVGQAAHEAKGRRQQEYELRWIDADLRNLVSYLMLGDVPALMKQPVLTKLFRRHWPAGTALDVDFQRLEALRNKSSHYRPFTARDLRNLQAFADTVCDLTAHYRQQRREAIRIEPNGNNLPEALRPVVRKWTRKLSRPGSRWAPVTMQILRRYLRIDMSLKAGELAPDAIGRFSSQVGLDCLFLVVNHAEGRVACYVPTCLDELDIIRLLDGLEDIQSTDPIVGSFDPITDACEFVFTSWVDLPVPFRYESNPP